MAAAVWLHLSLFAIGAAVFNYCLYYQTHLFDGIDLSNNTNLSEIVNASRQWGGDWKFLTVWSLTVQCVYYSAAALLCLLALATGYRCPALALTPAASAKARAVLDCVFLGLALPTACVVSLLFWSLELYDSTLVFPPGVRQYYPELLNQGVHTLPVLLNLINALLVRRSSGGGAGGSGSSSGGAGGGDSSRAGAETGAQLPVLLPPRRYTYTILVMFVGAYTAWTLYLGVVADVWVYGVFEQLDWPGRVGLMAGSFVLALAFCELGYRLQAWADTGCRLCFRSGRAHIKSQ